MMSILLDPSDKTDRKNLSSQDSSDEENETIDQIEQKVRADAELAQKQNKIPPKISANRFPPKKGCLSNLKSKGSNNQVIRYSRTPPTKPEDFDVPIAFEPDTVQQIRRVQFGFPSAVEYETESGHLTPMSEDLARKRFSMDPKEVTYEEEKMTKETKENSKLLSEWDDELPTGNFSRRKPSKTSMKTRVRVTHLSSSRLKKRNRRSSSTFRSCLKYDEQMKSNCDNSRNEHSPCLLSKASDVSPSMIVSKSLASLTMSPSNSSPKEMIKPFFAGTVTDEQRTWNFTADLGAINSNGARESSPPLQSEKIKLILAHDPKVHHDTVTNMEASGFNEKEAATFPSCKDSICDCVDAIAIAHSNNILQNLIKRPSLDQELEYKSVLQNLASTRNDTTTFFERSLMLFPSCHSDFNDKALSCMNDLFRELRIATQSSKSTHESYNQIQFLDMEIHYILKFTKSLELERAKASSSCLYFLEENQCIKFDLEKNVVNEIVRLESDVRQEKYALDLCEASSAPLSCILCQATVHLCVHGFSLEKFSGDHILKLNFVHGVYGVETRVLFDINSQERMIIEHTSNYNSENKCPIFALHHRYLNMLVSGNIPLQLSPTEPQESLLKIGQFLGKLDQIIIELEKRKLANKQYDLSEETKAEIHHFVCRILPFICNNLNDLSDDMV